MLTSLVGAISIDINYIMGAGGNLTIQQVNNPASSKGDPLFMQHLNTAWEASDFITKMSLQPCVYLNSYGNIRRIEAISDYHRSCADGLTYRCVDPSSANFDNTSSALQVGAHIQITYNDGDASAPGTLSLFFSPRSPNPQNLHQTLTFPSTPYTTPTAMVPLLYQPHRRPENRRDRKQLQLQSPNLHLLRYVPQPNRHLLSLLL